MSTSMQSGDTWPPPDEATQGHHLSGHADKVEYGHSIGPLANGSFRGMSVNVGGLAKKADDCTRAELLINLLKDHGPDALAIQEHGINFRNAGVKGQWKSRIGWNVHLNGRNTKTTAAYNENDRTSSIQQWGGTAIIAQGDTAKWAAGAGRDPSGLGRWSWTRYRRQQNTFLRFVFVYRPVKSPSKQSSAYSKQKAFLLSTDEYRCPRDALLEDLGTELDSWLANGDHIIVCGDWNEDVLGPTITDFFASRQMHNMVFALHNPQEAPETCRTNQSNTSVDGIFATPGIIPTKAGYMSYSDSPADHRVLWFDVEFQHVFGHAPPQIWKPQFRRLQLMDPNCVKRYNRILKQLLLQHKLFQRQYQLEQDTATNYMSPAHLQEANTIDNLTVQCQHQAEKQCRKIRAGAIHFSIATAMPRRRIKFWRIAINRRLGRGRASARYWLRAKRVPLYHPKQEMVTS